MNRGIELVPPQTIAVCCSCSDLMYTDFALCLATLAHTTRHRLQFFFARSSLIADNRNNAVKMVYMAQDQTGLRFSHVLWLDTDMIFPPVCPEDVLDRLLSHRKDIVGASYPRRAPPHSMTHRLLPGEVPNGEVLQRVAFLPGGVMLVSMDVYNSMPARWYEHYTATGRDDPLFTKFLPWMGPIPPGYTDEDIFPLAFGEDAYFCMNANAAGFEVWIDNPLTAVIRHVGVTSFGIEHVQRGSIQ